MKHDPIYPYLPLQLPLFPLPNMFPLSFKSSFLLFCLINQEVQLTLPICAWVWGHPLECGKTISVTISKKNNFFVPLLLPAASNFSVQIAPGECLPLLSGEKAWRSQLHQVQRRHSRSFPSSGLHTLSAFSPVLALWLGKGGS